MARQDAELKGVVGRLATTIVPAASLLVLAGFLDGVPQALCWVLALAIDYGGLAVRGTSGWHVVAGHFAERHGLIIIVALGESIVALGVGAGGLELDAGVIAGALFGIAAAAALWWAYFDVVAPHAERRLSQAPDAERVDLARDSYTYLHLPMVAGIILFAVGVKKTLGHYDEHLSAVPAAALTGGVALYLTALSSFRRRNVGTFNRRRLAAAVVLVAMTPLAAEIPALETLALVAVVTISLIAYEALRFAEARDRIRHDPEFTLR
jgi:low temperature requirement protein LtrA